ncbi:MAG: mechanosensitive ion channel family protein [Bacilli bacterium]|jgi:small conductance mechanosensitive channel
METIVFTSVEDFFKNLWDSIYNFWFNTSTDTTPYFYNVIAAIIWLVLSYFIIKFILFLIRKGMKLTKNKAREKTAKSFILDVAKIILYLLDFICVLKILRVELTGVSTIFSSAILAIGLSLQDLVGNFASGLIILSSQHFNVGDYISIKDCAEGEVTAVRFLTTSLNTIAGQKVVVSNSTIVKSVITNFSVNPTRLLKISLVFSYQEDPEKVRKVLLEMIKSEKRVLKTPEPTVVIGELSDSGVTYYLKCQTATIDYWDILYSVNENIVNELRKKNLKVQPSKVQLLSATVAGKEDDEDSKA